MVLGEGVGGRRTDRGELEVTQCSQVTAALR